MRKMHEKICALFFSIWLPYAVLCDKTVNLLTRPYIIDFDIQAKRTLASSKTMPMMCVPRLKLEFAEFDPADACVPTLFFKRLDFPLKAVSRILAIVTFNINSIALFIYCWFLIITIMPQKFAERRNVWGVLHPKRYLW